MELTPSNSSLPGTELPIPYMINTLGKENTIQGKVFDQILNYCEEAAKELLVRKMVNKHDVTGLKQDPKAKRGKCK